MSNTVVVETLEQLRPFLNDKHVIEIVQRGKNKKFKNFVKVALNELPQTEEKALVENAVNVLNKNLQLNHRNLQLLANVAKSQKLGLLLNGLNLCATCVGFAIMYAKLDSMSAEINQQIAKVEKTVKKVQDVQAGFEFNKVLSDHTDMLDCRKKQQPYSEEKMRELVDNEYNVLTMLISAFQMDLSADKKNTIFSIYSLLSMLTVSLMYFDEVYYQNNHEVLGEGEVWHTAHEKWMGVYKTLSEDWVIEKLQDYGMFETNLTILGVDVFYKGLLDQVREERENVEDNQALILALGDIELLHALQEKSDREVKESIREAFENAGAESDATVIQVAYDNALKLAAIA